MIDIRSNIDAIMKIVQRDISEMRKELDTLKDDFALTTQQVMQEKVPVRTGALRSSVMVKRRGRNEYAVGPTHPKAYIINRGARPSRGRFVAAIGRRIGTGQHPGTSGTHFLEDTFSEVLRIVDARLRKR